MQTKIKNIASQLLALSTSLFVASCASPPQLPNVKSHAAEQSINTPEQAKLLKEKYSK